MHQVDHEAIDASLGHALSLIDREMSLLETKRHAIQLALNGNGKPPPGATSLDREPWLRIHPGHPAKVAARTHTTKTAKTSPVITGNEGVLRILREAGKSMFPDEILKKLRTMQHEILQRSNARGIDLRFVQQVLVRLHTQFHAIRYVGDRIMARGGTAVELNPAYLKKLTAAKGKEEQHG